MQSNIIRLPFHTVIYAVPYFLLLSASCPSVASLTKPPWTPETSQNCLVSGKPHPRDNLNERGAGSLRPSSYSSDFRQSKTFFIHQMQCILSNDLLLCRIRKGAGLMVRTLELPWVSWSHPFWVWGTLPGLIFYIFWECLRKSHGNEHLPMYLL